MIKDKETKNGGKYDDIINMPHHRSIKHPHMNMKNRAAQFAPFAALTGFDEQIEAAYDEYESGFE